MLFGKYVNKYYRKYWYLFLIAVITLIDSGKPYDPLAKPDPDVTLSAEERPIGGLGIFMVKKTMDDVTYEYKDGKNILSIKKNI